ncbi:hypothetical protein EVAR_89106_1 [Eumeta japonica]|uniref:Uncharacterized protein n=1 Tax=Eumeta variegata TaxID=151549 RepID=A0A4C1XD05_EUMVA|nr:hypothetical protein EVAR_89106_1 [Eumeta japonica]
MPITAQLKKNNIYLGLAEPYPVWRRRARPGFIAFTSDRDAGAYELYTSISRFVCDKSSSATEQRVSDQTFSCSPRSDYEVFRQYGAIIEFSISDRSSF